MKVFQYIFLSICAMAEAALLIFGILSLVIFILDPDPDVPIAMVAAVTACAMVLLGITVSSFIKAAKDREHPILYGFLFKGPVLIFQGDEDSVVPPESSYRAAQKYEQAEVILLKGEGHGISESGVAFAMNRMLRLIDETRKRSAV